MPYGVATALATLALFGLLSGNARAQDRCAATVDKFAEPARLPLGDTVTVTLDVTGACPSRTVTADIMLVLDASQSMGWDGKIEAAKRAAKTFVSSMDPALVRVGLISFYSVAILEQPLTADQAAVSRAIDSVVIDRGTNLVDSMDLARREMTSAAVRPDANRVIVFITDGRHRVTQPPLSALDPVLAAVRLAGIEVFSIGIGNDHDIAVLQRMAASPNHYFVSPGAAELEDILRRVAGTVQAQVLFTSARVTDRLPANMRYVPGYGTPVEPAVSPDGRTLVWDLVNVREPGTRLAFRVRPDEVGRWPTNTSADLTYSDGFGEPGALQFPVPVVEVYAESQPPAAGCVCPFVRLRVPPEVIDAILANPSATYGWQIPLDPGKPPGPNNPPRRCLTLRNQALDYDPVWNRPIWRVGCIR